MLLARSILFFLILSSINDGKVMEWQNHYVYDDSDFVVEAIFELNPLCGGYF